MSNAILKQIRARKTSGIKAGGSSIGAMPSVSDPTLQAWIKNISQELNEASKKYARTSDLAKAGLINIENGQINVPGTNEDNSTIVPKAVLNLIAKGAYSTATLSWETQDSKYFGRNEVFRSENDDFGTAVYIGSSVGNVYTDYIGNNSKAFYWVRTVSKFGVVGELAPSVFAATSIDVDYLIENLSGQINEGTLSQELKKQINKIGTVDSDVQNILDDIKNNIKVQQENLKSTVEDLLTQANLTDIRLSLEETTRATQLANESLTRAEQFKQEALARTVDINAQVKTASDSLNLQINDVKKQVIELEKDVDISVQNVNTEVNSIKSQISTIQTDQNKDVAERKADISKLRNDVNTSISALNTRADAIVETVTNETATRITDVKKLGDGLTTETQARKDGDTASLTAINNYKSSNDTALANVRSQVSTLTTKSTALSESITALDTRLTTNEDNTKSVNTLAASANDKATTALTQNSALSTRITSTEASISTLNDGIKTKADTTSFNQLSNKVESINGVVTINSSDITGLKSSVTNLDGKISGNASAINDLKTNQTTQGNTISSQGQAITSLENNVSSVTNTLSTKADSTAVNQLQSQVTAIDGKVTNQGTQIVSLNNAISASNASSGDYIPNPTFDPKYSQMGYTVLASSASEVPTGCPFPYVAKLSARDHVPSIDAIAWKVGDVIEISALVASDANATANFNLYIYRQKAPNSGASAYINGGNQAPTQTWTRKTWKFTVSSGYVLNGTTNYPFFKPFLQINQSSPFGSIWYVADWHVKNITAAAQAQATADATSTALSGLDSKVTQQGNTITSQGQAITSLQNNITTINSDLATKASTTALSTLDSKVTTQGNTVTTNTSKITALETSVSSINDDVKGNTSAINDMKAVQTQQGNKITQITSDTTTLASNLSTVSNQLNTKADTAALNTLKTQVEQQGSTITSQGNQITNLKNNVDVIDQTVSKKADSDVVSSLNSRVINNEGQLTTQSGQITSLTNTIKNIAVGARNLAIGTSNTLKQVVDSTVAYEKYFNVSEALKPNVPVTVSFEISDVTNNPRISVILMGQYGTSDRFGIVGNQNVITGQNTFTVTPVNTVYGAPLKLRFVNENKVESSSFKILSVKLERGNKSTDWSPAPEDFQSQITATANAVATLQNTTIQQGNTVTSQGNSITSLQGSVTTINNALNSKADNSAVQTLGNRVTATENAITSSTQSATVLENKVDTALNAINSDKGVKTFYQNVEPTITGVKRNLLASNSSGRSAVWYPLGTNGNSVLDTAEQAPDGTSGGVRKVTLTAQSIIRVGNTSGGTANTIYVGSMWIKLADSRDTAIAVTDVNDNTANGKSYNLTKNWQRVWCYGSHNGAFLFFDALVPAGDYHVYGGQLETGTIPSAYQDVISTANFDGSGIPVGSIWYKTNDNNKAFRYNGSAWVEVTDSRVVANATAITSLQSSVTQQGNSITAQGNQITSINNSLTTINNTLGTKADNTALSQLEGRVTANESGIINQSKALTSLSNAVINYKQNLGDQNTWVVNVYSTQQSANTALLKPQELAQLQLFKTYELSDKDYFNLLPYGGNYKTYHFRAWYVVSSAFTWTPKFQVDDSVRMYVNNTQVFEQLGVTSGKDFSYDFAIGEYFIDFVFYNHTGASYLGFGGTGSRLSAQQNTLLYGATTQAALSSLSSSAISSLTSSTKQQGDMLTSQSGQITSLQNNLSTINTTLGNKADASALTTLDNKVTTQGNTITSQGNSITSLQNNVSSLTTTVNAKADNAALTALTTRVTSAETGISNQASQITNLSTGLSTVTNQVGNTKTYTIRTQQSISNTGKANGIFNSTGLRIHGINRGFNLYTIDGNSNINSVGSYDVYGNMATASEALDAALAAIATGTYFILIGCDNIRDFATNTNSSVISIRDQLTASGVSEFTLSRLNSSVVPIIVARKGGLNTVPIESLVINQWLELPLSITNGTPHGFNDNFPSIRRLNTTALALTDLTTTVTQQGEDLTTKSQQITNLENTLSSLSNTVNTKADSSALTNLTSRVSNSEGQLTTQSGQITSLSNSLASTDKKAYSQTRVLSPASFNPSAYTLDSNRVGSNANNVPESNVSIDNFFGQVCINDTAVRYLKHKSYLARKPGSIYRIWFTLKTSVAFNFNPILLAINKDLATANISGAAKTISILDTYITDYVDIVDNMTTLATTHPYCGAQITLPASTTANSILAKLWMEDITEQKALEATDGNQQTQITATANAVTTLQNTVTQQGNNITAQTGQITNINNSLSIINGTLSAKADNSALTALTTRVSNTESGLSNQASQVTNLSTQLTNVRNQANNLVFDGSFERLTTTSGSMSPSSTARFGSTSLKFTRTQAANNGNNNDITWQDFFDIADNRRYYLEIWARKDPDNSIAWNANSIVRIGLHSNSARGGNSWDGIVFDPSTLTDDWVKISGYFTIRAGQTRARVWMSIPSSATNVQGASVLLDDLYIADVTEGINATETANSTATALTSLTANVNQQGNMITSQGNSITALQNSLTTLNTNVGTKADSSTVSNLNNTVTQQGNTLTTQGNAITQIQGSIGTINTTLGTKADVVALNTLTGRVTSAENTLSSQSTSITQVQANIKANVASSGDLIPNPTFDPRYDQMGYTVISSTDAEVPANCPFPYVARLSTRDHAPNTDAIAWKVGDVYEISALVASNANATAPFTLYIYRLRTPTSGASALAQGGYLNPTQTWTRRTWQFKVTEGFVGSGTNSYNFFRPFLQINQSSPFGSIWYATDWHVKNITAAAQAQATADATSTALSGLDSKVTQQGNTITSQGNSITSLQSSVGSLNTALGTKADSSTVSALTNRVTATETQLTTQNSQITSLQSSLNGLSVGGTNLLAKVKMTNGFINAATGAEGVNTTHLRFKEAETLATRRTIVFSSGNSAVVLKVYPFVGDTYKGSVQLTAGSPYTFASDVTKFKIEVNGAGGNVETVTSYRLKLEYGSIATDWSPAPEDVQDQITATNSAVSTLNTDMTSIKGSVSSQGNSITSLQNNLSNLTNTVNSKADNSALTALTSRVTSTESSISSQSSQLTTLQSSINNLAIGGTNLLKNTVNYGSDGVYKGMNIKRSIRVANATSYVDSYSVSIPNGIADGGFYIASFYARASKAQEVSCFFYSPDNTRSAESSTGQKTSNANGQVAVNLTTEWKRYWIRWDAPANASKGMVLARLNTQDTETRWVEVAGIQLEKGTISSDWSPAPDDLATSAALSSLSSTVTQQGNTITSQANQLSQLNSTVGNNSLSIQQQAQTINGIKGLATLKIDNNGVMTGLGVTSEMLANGQVFSEIGFQANRFFFMAPDGKSYPFILDGGKAVFNSDVYIKNGSIKNAQIGDLAADKISSGDIAADRMKANIVQAVQGKFQSLSAITGTIGHLRTKTTGARTEIRDDLIEVYDENNVLRVRMGVWQE
ncbi:hypothetical protein KTN00_12205 [Acinetobacter soli]|uniref:hypothetical protein n=1 Tax=Acinetobacter soli TaxID=487316 RepID=UPI001C479E27|nr:hypothetical protein [Acinetobacter soli]MBV6551778.1 hypothetical protein [Acinetobacter soli]